VASRSCTYSKYCSANCEASNNRHCASAEMSVLPLASLKLPWAREPSTVSRASRSVFFITCRASRRLIADQSMEPEGELNRNAAARGGKGDGDRLDFIGISR
jgi:hypothetical protein